MEQKQNGLDLDALDATDFQARKSATAPVQPASQENGLKNFGISAQGSSQRRSIIHQGTQRRTEPLFAPCGKPGDTNKHSYLNVEFYEELTQFSETP